MNQHLKETLDDKASMTRFCEKLYPMVASTICTDISSVSMPQHAVIKNAKGCCGVHSFRGSRTAVEAWFERQSRRSLPSNEWIIQEHLGVLDEIRLVFGVHAKNDVRRVWCNTENPQLEKTALHILKRAMHTSQDHTVDTPFCIAFDFLPDGRLLEVNVEGMHFNPCPCRGRIERKPRRVATGANRVRGFLKTRTTDLRI